MLSIRQTSVAIAALAWVVSVSPVFAQALEPAEAVPKFTLKEKKVWPGELQLYFEFTNSYKHDVFALLECVGKDEAGKITHGPVQDLGGPELVDAGKTKVTEFLLAHNDLKGFREANQGKDPPEPAVIDCKVVKIEVMK